MIRIMFNGSPSAYSMDFSFSGERVILQGKKFPKKLNTGFKAYRLNGDFLGDYSAYVISEPIDGGYAFRKAVK